MHVSLIHVIWSPLSQINQWDGLEKRNGRDISAPVRNLRAVFYLVFSMSSHFIFSICNDSFQALYVDHRGVDSSYVKLSFAENILLSSTCDYHWIMLCLLTAAFYCWYMGRVHTLVTWNSQEFMILVLVVCCCCF